MSFFKNPEKTEGGQRKVVVSDFTVQQLLTNILKELRIMNLHLMAITGEKFKKQKGDI